MSWLKKLLQNTKHEMQKELLGTLPQPFYLSAADIYVIDNFYISGSFFRNLHKLSPKRSYLLSLITDAEGNINIRKFTFEDKELIYN